MKIVKVNSKIQIITQVAVQNVLYASCIGLFIGLTRKKKQKKMSKKEKITIDINCLY